MKTATRPANIHAHLSFDGRGINDRTEYRERIATFTKGGGNPGDYDPAKEYGHLFAAAPDMLAALEGMLELYATGDEDFSTVQDARAAVARAKGQVIS